MKSPFFKSTTSSIGALANVGSLRQFLSDYINIIFPNNGIDYWSDDKYREAAYRNNDPLPTTGNNAKDVSEVAAYSVKGGSEGYRVRVFLHLNDGTHQFLASCKVFGTARDSWEIAIAVSEVLENLFFFQRIPNLVAMHALLPRKNKCDLNSTIIGPVIISQSTSSLVVCTLDGFLIDIIDAKHDGLQSFNEIENYRQDWEYILRINSVQFSVQQQKVYPFIDLPGYIISDRGVPDITGVYALPPNGNPNDDRDYLGYFKTIDDAVNACKSHQSTQLQRHQELVVQS